MSDPFDLSVPFPCGDEDREFVQPARHRALVSQILADFLRALHELGAAQERVVRPVRIDLAAKAACELLSSLALRFGHLVFGQRLESGLRLRLCEAGCDGEKT